MPPTDRFVISFAAEPPQEGIPYGRWADTLREHFLAAVREIDTEGEELGTPAEPGSAQRTPDTVHPSWLLSASSKRSMTACGLPACLRKLQKLSFRKCREIFSSARR